MVRPCLTLTFSILAAWPAGASEVAKVPVETFEPSNGMKFLAEVRPELVSSGFVEIAPGGAGAKMRREVTHFPLRDPLTLKAIP